MSSTSASMMSASGTGSMPLISTATTRPPWLSPALAFAEDVLAADGAFVCKVLGSGADAGLLAAIKRAFAVVKHAKPPASRDESAELYLVATGFRGHQDEKT